MQYKIPESVLVVIYTTALEVLLLERADHPGFWQSVTGSRATADESLVQTCLREVREETGLVTATADYADWRHVNRYAIYPHWRHRYAAGVTHNTEHVFGLAVVAPFDVVLAAREHTRFQWCPWRQAADLCFSWTNAQAVRMLPDRAGRPV